jgi:hypothetical protein
MVKFRTALANLPRIGKLVPTVEDQRLERDGEAM